MSSDEDKKKKKKSRHVGQWNRIDSPEINPHLYGQLMFEKEARSYNEAMVVHSINDVGKIGQILAENEIKLSSYTIHRDKLKMG